MSIIARGHLMSSRVALLSVDSQPLGARLPVRPKVLHVEKVFLLH